MNKPMNTSPHVLHPDQVAAYQPANHTGTSNRRVISRDTIGAQRLEVLIGTISKGHGAQRHAHPSLEQASYLLRGTGVSEVYGQERHMSAGEWGFNPKGVFHSFTVTSDEPAQVLVVYAPPYRENPRAVVVHNPAHAQAEPRPPVTMAAAPVPVSWEGTEGARVETVVDTATAGAQHLAIHRVLALTGAHGRARQRERVLYVLDGAVEGQVDQRAFEAGAASLVFVPEGAVWQWRSGRAGAAFFVIDAETGSFAELDCCLIFVPLNVTMSQKHSLLQSAQSVS